MSGSSPHRFSSRNFIVSGVTFESLIHLELIFLCGWVSGPVSLFYMWLSSFPRTIHWRDCRFSIVSPRLLCCKLIDHICMGLFRGSLFCPIDLCVCFDANTILFWWLYPCNMFKIRDPLALLAISQDCLDYWGSFWFHTSFRDCSFYFCKKCHWNFNRDWICRWHWLYGHFNNILSVREHRISFHFFGSSSVFFFINVLNFHCTGLLPPWLN